MQVPLHNHLLLQCPQCQIKFITSKSNRGRKDIRCSFGCRLIHKKRESNKRSINYNKSPEAKAKKKALNQHRKKKLAKHGPATPDTTSFGLIYIRLLLTAIFKKKLEVTKIQQLREMAREELRQHTLEQIVKLLIVRGYG